ncbi:MAG: NAD(P)H-dependent oxidoreductase [Alcaligenaceae bacterium]|nr:NAD(P)H-dependent oxidoreductase [Alcaligenaceae bacterium]
MTNNEFDAIYLEASMCLDPKRLLIIWHSRTATSEQAANAAMHAARSTIEELVTLEADSNIRHYEVLLRKASEVSLAELLSAQAYLFCAPENLASLSGQMKEFFDQYYYDLLGKIEGRYYSAIIAAGTDGAGALKQLERICTGWRLNQAVPAIILNTGSATEEEIRAQKQLSPEQIARAEEIGSTLMALLSA